MSGPAPPGHPALIALLLLFSSSCGSVSDPEVASCSSGLENPSAVVDPAKIEPLKLGQVAKIPTYGTCVERITDREAHDARRLSHGSVTRQPLNADQSLLLLENGTVIEAETSVPVASLKGEDASWVWDPADPGRLFGTIERGLRSFNAFTGASRAIDLPGYSAIVSVPERADPTAGGLWLLSAKSESGAVEMLVLDLASRRVVSAFPLAMDRLSRVISPVQAKLSPSGLKVALSFRDTDGRSRTELWTPAGARVAELSTHADSFALARSSDNQEWLIQAVPHVDGTSLVRTSLDPPFASETLLEIHGDQSASVSCLADRSDECVVSTYDYDATPSSLGLRGEVISIGIGDGPGLGRITRWLQHQSEPSAFAAHSQSDCPIEASTALPKAVQSRDNRRIFFASNWRNQCVSELYQITR